MPRSRAIAATRAKSASRSSRPLERARLLPDLGQELRRRARACLRRRQASPLRRARARSRGSPSRTSRSARRPRLDPAGVGQPEHGGRDEVAALERAARAGTPSSCRFRTASIIVRTLPASTPSSRRTAPSRTTRSTSPSVNSPAPAPARRDGVGDERDPPGGGLPHEAHGVGGEVDAVDDDLDDDVGPGQRRADDARIAVPERPHRVEEVGHRVDAPVEGRVRLLARGVGVAERDDDAALVEQLDQVVGAGQLGRERDEPAPGPRRAAARAAPGRGRAGAAGGCVPGRRGERNGPSTWTPRIRGPPRRQRHLAQRGDQVLLRRT